VGQAVQDRALGVKIRRQHPIGRFIADFSCAGAKLIVEINGEVHVEPGQAEYEAARTEWLKGRGF
jgi:very-short-patch-repair endonuclease